MTDGAERPRRGYHHGDLREALIEATRALLAEKGAEGFTLADAARRAGVSPAAPYRHFADRGALLAEVARRGFEAFVARLSRAGGAADAAGAFRGMGRAYLAFAREEPGYYAAMFMGRSGEKRGGPGAPGAAFAMLVDALAATAARRGARLADPADLALQVWSLSHGVATLAATGRLGGLCDDPEAVLDRGVEALVAGAVARSRDDGV